MLSSCLNLEWLGLRKCTLPHKVLISGLFSLEFLSINSCKDVEEIELLAVNLTTFELGDMELEKLLFSCVPKLKIVHLSSCLRKLDEQYVLSTPAKDLPQLEILTFFSLCTKGELGHGIFIFFWSTYFDRFLFSLIYIFFSGRTHTNYIQQCPATKLVFEDGEGGLRFCMEYHSPFESFPPSSETLFNGESSQLGMGFIYLTIICLSTCPPAGGLLWWMILYSFNFDLGLVVYFHWTRDDYYSLCSTQKKVPFGQRSTFVLYIESFFHDSIIMWSSLSS